MISDRRRVFRAATAILGYSTIDVAARLGCSHTHLTLVLDGARKPSARLEKEIQALLREAKPVLLAALDQV